VRGIHRPIHTTHTRDAALRQLARANRWLIAGSVVLTGVLADIAANAFPGKSAAGASTTKAKGHAKHAPSAGSNTTTGVLRPPAQAPNSQAESSQQAAPAEPAPEPAPSQEQAPPRESAPAQESAPAPEATPEREAPREPAPAEESGPVVSGGS
jgi:hypothetical protein